MIEPLQEGAGNFPITMKDKINELIEVVNYMNWDIGTNKGTGISPIECKECKGTGVTDLEETAMYQSTCPKCNGTGRYSDTKGMCLHCNGSGQANKSFDMSGPEHTCGLNFYCHGCYNLGYGQAIMDGQAKVVEKEKDDFNEAMDNARAYWDRQIAEKDLIIAQLREELQKPSPQAEKVYIGISKCCDKPAHRFNGISGTINTCDNCGKACDIYRPNEVKSPLCQECGKAISSGMYCDKCKPLGLEEILIKNIGADKALVEDLAAAIRAYLKEVIEGMAKEEPLGHNADIDEARFFINSYNQALQDLKDKLEIK